ncbi:MAG TPA: response regulator [Myxococcales bacterium]|nr:response regulator [Myxococcales bacterium]
MMRERPSILVVEDDDDCRSVLVDLLEMSGYSVLSCGEAHRAVQLAREHPPALVLVDFMMPDADGGWLVRSLRAEGGNLAEVPVVLTTGSSDGREIADALGVRSLEKPFDVNRLLDLVRALAPLS